MQNAAQYSEMAGRIDARLLKALANMNYTTMSPVQQEVLSLPSFTKDCLVQAKTGTGKTIAFLLPALQTLLTSPKLPRGQVGILIMAPTRELAQQIADECDKLTATIRPALECHLAVGGSNKNSHLRRFTEGNPTVMVATPGRLLDYLSDPAVRARFTSIRNVILDEADRMLDQGFVPDVMRILQTLPSKQSANWQGMCFSATVPKGIEKVVHLVLDKDHARISTIVEGEEPTVNRIPQSYLPVASVDQVLPTLHSLLAIESLNNRNLKAVVFSSTARHAGLLYHVFASTGGAAPGKLPVFQMQSRMSQTQRTRTVDEFKNAERGLLFASDVVGRGMDFPDVSLVVQIGPPSESEQYVHRVGRTGRAGKSGRATMIVLPQEMRFMTKNPSFPIQKSALEHPQLATFNSDKVISSALAKVPLQTKEQAYIAFLGYTNSQKKDYGIQSDGVVRLANELSEAMGLTQLPMIEARTVGKMGLKGVPGLNVGTPQNLRNPNSNTGRNPFLSDLKPRPPPENNFRRRPGPPPPAAGSKNKKPIDEAAPSPSSRPTQPKKPRR
ncbi:P-loop containing nucleoside triphosphate hydrolase protein [Lasiosphaeria miniovina]|uniref:ATP-dependent RNA helicase n=1 Tax=Lasiosphaeria miniovina TaxID=1954250 RepID=A0AA40B4T3_9PEZI|nr:P-loop containing nucleoside triphosphate hydrolase protein [Lasiosphaeria miniovina]KAK0727696.1 P-loop containing nucleoside triphosphate hydrolase protein [Lasiosphaeria miniovina]